MRLLVLTRLSLLGLLALVLTSGGSADAAPGANGKIAYVTPGAPGSSLIWVVNPDGSGTRRLIEGREPSWSPDGSRLAYVGPDRTDGSAIFVVDANGDDQRRLTAAGAGVEPDWSADGTSITFARLGDIYAIEVDGSGLRQLTAGVPSDRTPSSSPDGLTVAFERGGVLWLMDAEGGNQRSLGIDGSRPRFSPDGRMLAFEDGSAMYVVDADGTGASRRVSPEGSEVSAPAWSPDGSQLAFYEGAQGVCTISTSGAAAARRVTYDGNDNGLDWQPRSVASGGDSRYSCFSPRWDLRLSITTTRPRAAIGSYVQFRIVLSNDGPDPATDTGFSIYWPGESEFSAISGPCGPVEGAFTHCSPGVVYPGRPVVATVSVRMQGPGPQRVYTEMDEFNDPRDTNGANDRDDARVVVGDCTITGTTGADVLTGTRRRDVICGLDGHDVIRGLGGDDEIWSGGRDDVVDGGPGDDRILGSSGDDDLEGGDGRDVVWGGFGKDRVFGGQGDDALHGFDRLDRFDGSGPPSLTSDSDVLDGGFGSDLVDGGAGEDTLRGGQGTDIVLARDGFNDRVDCGQGRDRLTADRFDRQRRCDRVSRG